MLRNTRILGKQGEDVAIAFLKNNGYKILERNYTTKLGEIDIIARERGVLCFIEVKTRTSLSKGYPKEGITLKKQRQLSKVALSYLKQNSLMNHHARFDVLSVILNDAKADFELLKNAFNLCDDYAY